MIIVGIADGADGSYALLSPATAQTLAFNSDSSHHAIAAPTHP